MTPATPNGKVKQYTIQVAPEDCTGCGMCVDVCPVKNKSAANLKAINMMPQPPLREQERDNWNFFLGLPEIDRRDIKVSTIRQQQVQQPLFEFSGACSGCGETPYLKLISQLFGDRTRDRQCDRLLVDLRRQPADDPLGAQSAKGAVRPGRTRCLKTTPNSVWGCASRSTSRSNLPANCCSRLSAEIGGELVDALLNADQSDEAGIHDQRERVALLKERLHSIKSDDARQLHRWRMCWSRKTCGSSAATAGRMTSATAVWIT